MALEASLRQYIGATQVYPSLILQQISWTLFASFCLFVRTLPGTYWFCFTGAERKYIKSKTTAKLTEKRTSIAAVRDILWTFVTFPTPLLSCYRLPLNVKLLSVRPPWYLVASVVDPDPVDLDCPPGSGSINYELRIRLRNLVIINGLKKIKKKSATFYPLITYVFLSLGTKMSW